MPPRLPFQPATLLGVALLWGATLTGCATAPETGRSQLLLVDSAQETKLGLQAFQEIKAKTPISHDPKKNAELQAVGQRIAQVARLPNARWEFVLFDDPKQANAFALPGGKVGIYTGILPITQNAAGLATVIGHEVAHAAARHGAERMSQSLAVQVGGSVLSAALGASGYGGVGRDVAMQAYGLGAQVGVLLPYSRTQELEADRIGLLYMARAGFDPREAVAFWQRFQTHNAKRGGSALEFLSTHPLDDNRIAKLKEFLPQALAEYERTQRRG
ncbi:MAG: M48 family metallopeptidase [Bdellovibrio bacteriovorus]